MRTMCCRALVLIGILLVAEVIADKIPHFDHILHVVMSVVHGLAGATALIAPIQRCDGTAHVAAIGTGAVLALIIHGGRAAVRLLSTATTGGASNCCISVVEDIIVFILCPIAITVQFSQTQSHSQLYDRPKLSRNYRS